MKRTMILLLTILALPVWAERLGYHEIQTDANGRIVSWAAPELAPAGQDHLLRSSWVIQQIEFGKEAIRYRTFDAASRERLRIGFEPAGVTARGRRLRKSEQMEDLGRREGYFFAASGPANGLLEIRHARSGTIVIARGLSR